MRSDGLGCDPAFVSMGIGMLEPRGVLATARAMGMGGHGAGSNAPPIAHGTADRRHAQPQESGEWEESIVIRAVQMFTVRDLLGDAAEVRHTLAHIREIGYDAIQAGTPRFLTHGEFKTMADDAGLAMLSAHADFQEMIDDPAAITAAVAQARCYGVGFIAVGTLPERMRESEEGYRAYAQHINRLARELSGDGMRLLYHPHALECYSLGGGRMGLDILLAETDPDGLWFTLDTHWMQAGGLDADAWIAKVRGRMDLIHFKDYAIAGGAERVEDVSRRFAEVGEGNLNWPRIVAACKENGVRAVAVEQDVCPGDPLDSLAISYRNLKRLGV